MENRHWSASGPIHTPILLHKYPCQRIGLRKYYGCLTFNLSLFQKRGKEIAIAEMTNKKWAKTRSILDNWTIVIREKWLRENSFFDHVQLLYLYPCPSFTDLFDLTTRQVYNRFKTCETGSLLWGWSGGHRELSLFKLCIN